MNERIKINKLLDTIKSNGGVTFDNELNILNFDNGFIVSVKNVIESVSLVKVVNKLVKLDKTHKIYGIWEDNGTYYLDINKRILSKQRAIDTGIVFKQLSIYDAKNDNCISL